MDMFLGAQACVDAVRYVRRSRARSERVDTIRSALLMQVLVSPQVYLTSNKHRQPSWQFCQ